ncbi:glycosyltransferase [Azospirillum brasilense]|nr:glycosyltransferase [Azospirillum brasilense]
MAMQNHEAAPLLIALHHTTGINLLSSDGRASKPLTELDVSAILAFRTSLPEGLSEEIAHRFLIGDPAAVTPLVYLITSALIEGDLATAAKMLRVANLYAPQHSEISLLHAFIACQRGDLVRMTACLSRAAQQSASSDLLLNFTQHVLHTMLTRPDTAPPARLGMIAYQRGGQVTIAVAVGGRSAPFEVKIAVTHRAIRRTVPVPLKEWTTLEGFTLLLGEFSLPVEVSVNHPCGIAFADDGTSFVNAPLAPLSDDVEIGIHAVRLPTLPAAPKAIELGAPMSVDIIIPVYQRPDLLDRLLNTLLDDLPDERIERLIIIDDASDPFTARYLEGLGEVLGRKFILLRNRENLGFLESCNRAFSASQAPFVILLNSDIELPTGWLDRLMAPFVHDASIGLVTPLATSGANLTVTLQPGQDWREADAIAGQRSPRYADACTAIGYCLAIRRTALPTGPLFDPVYSHGYGEDSDLHYRVKRRGARSVICDNLVIHHHGSASYLLQPDLSRIQARNRRVFFSRWGQTHIADELSYNLSGSLRHLMDGHGNLNALLANQAVDALFILPTDALQYGGVRATVSLVEYLVARGWNAKILCLTEAHQIASGWKGGVRPYVDLNHALRDITELTVVVPTCIDTIETARLLSSHFKAPILWFLQGPEAYFDGGKTFPAFRDALRNVDHIVGVSDYLRNFAQTLSGRSIATIPFGPNPLVFYPRTGKPRRPRSIAMAIPGSVEKGAGLALPVAEVLREQGFSLSFFGKQTDTAEALAGFGEVHGFLEPAKVAQLFSQVEFYLDFSLYEGLGLLPLEAAFCGAIPVMTRKGAPETIFTHGRDAVFIDNFLDIDAVARTIATIEQSDLEDLRRGGQALAHRVGEQRGYAAFESCLKGLGLTPQGAGRGLLYQCPKQK